MLRAVSQAGAATTATLLVDGGAGASFPISSSSSTGSGFEVGSVAEPGMSTSMGPESSVVRVGAGGIVAVEGTGDALTGDSSCDRVSRNGAGTTVTAEKVGGLVNSGS